MNTLNATGWLQRDAWSATVPTPPYRQVLLFDLMLANGGTDAAPWHCEIADEELAKHVAKKLTSGAGVIVRAELRSRPFVQHGVTKGHTRYLLVDRIEFSRLPVAAEQPEPAAQHTS